jgi:hypothetical protein
MGYTECSYTNCGNPVFSRGICRKHYEQERLETASPCSFSGCDKKSYRGALCSAHYRAEQLKKHPICAVAGCENHQKTLSSGLCEKHLFRYTRHGSIEQPRNKDWGARETHPLYGTYHGQRRKPNGMCKEWADDFWVFVKAVSPKPEGHTLRKYNQKEPIGPSNWYWKESIPSKDPAKWQKVWREHNPDKVKNMQLRKMYGITFDEYKTMLEGQRHKCAICNNPETAVDAKGAERFMAVDHCHKSGKIRALLCAACNKSLGGFKDDPKLLRKAAEYLEAHATADIV